MRYSELYVLLDFLVFVDSLNRALNKSTRLFINYWPKMIFEIENSVQIVYNKSDAAKQILCFWTYPIPLGWPIATAAI